MATPPMDERPQRRKLPEDRLDLLAYPSPRREEGAHLQVLAHGEGGEDVVVLGDVAETHPGEALGGPARDVFAPQQDRTREDPRLAHEGLQERGLAGAVGP